MTSDRGWGGDPAAVDATESGGPSRWRRAWIGVLVVAAVAAPFVLAAAAHAPTLPAPALASTGTLPVAGSPADLSTQLDHVPLLVGDLPDEASQAALDTYRRADIFAAEDVESAFFDAWAAMALHAPAEDATRILEFPSRVVAIDAFSELPEGADAVLDALADDADNAARLTNAAVMLFGYGALIDSGMAPVAEGADYGYPWVLESQAVLLLDEVERRFGSSRHVALNRALFSTLTDPLALDPAIEAVAAVVAADPGDVTARWMLASLQARRAEDSGGYEDAVATLQPLLADPATRLLGEAGLGDAYLAAASLRAAEGPRTSAVLARRAIDHYDRVLEEAADPGVYAGRARALALLGDATGAVAAMREAVARSPGAVDLSLALAALQQAAGDTQGMYDTAVAALERTGAGWVPQLAEVRYVASGAATHPGDLGLFGVSVGSTRDHVAIIRYLEGGGYLADIEVVPAVTDPYLDDNRRAGFAPDVAARLAVDAAVAQGAPADAAAARDMWSRQDSTTSQALADTVRHQLETGVAAAALVGGGDLFRLPDEHGVSGALLAAQAVLRRSGDYAGMESLCRRLLDGEAAAADPLTQENLWLCIGDSLVLQGRHAEAASLYADAAEVLQPDFTPGPDLLLHWGATSVTVEPGGTEGRRLLQELATGSTHREAALVRLGIDDLDRGLPASAVAHYDLVLALLDTALAASPEEDAAIRQARAVALTNRGVSRLRLAQDDPARPPVCDAAAEDDPCRAAAADFAAALDVDPLNAVILMNQAWADRAMGRTEEARQALEEAVSIDATLYPAANDLAVLAAEAGDVAAAKHALTAALAENPDYALGWWNLGVLEQRRGVAGLAAGQAALATAIRLDPSLADDPLDFVTDEAVYRVTFDSVEEASGGWPVGRTYALAAAVLGGVGLLSALGRLGSSFLGELWSELWSWAGMSPEKRPAWASRLAAPLGNAGRRLRRRVPAGVARLLPWIVTAAVLALVSVWTVWSQQPGTVVAGLAAVAIATVAALAAHEAGHLMAVRRWGGRLVPDQWSGGVALALLLIPVNASSGPYFAERVEGVDDDRLARIHAAGPVTNLVLAAAAYLAYLARPVPLLLLTSQVSLAVCAYALLPNLPLDGRPLKDHPVAASLLGLVVAGAGAAFALT